MAKIQADVSNMLTAKDPPGGIATNSNVNSGGSTTAPVILTPGHAAHPLGREEK